MKKNWNYGWDNGRLVLEKGLMKKDEKLIKEITDVAFKEMGERTRMGSGDDQVYVDGLYDKLRTDNTSIMLVRVVCLLCKQLEKESR